MKFFSFMFLHSFKMKLWDTTYNILEESIYFVFNPCGTYHFNTLKEHQRIPKKMTVSKDSDNSFNMGIYENFFF